MQTRADLLNWWTDPACTAHARPLGRRQHSLGPQETVLSIADFKLKEGGSMVAKHFEGARHLATATKLLMPLLVRRHVL